MPGWGVCNLSSINLSKFYDEVNDDVDWDELGMVVNYSVRFLDNVIDATPYHFEANRENQQKERRVGLGSMGLAELLIKLKIRYGSPECIAFLDKLYGFIAKKTYEASIDIAEEKGAFPPFDFDDYLYNSEAETETFAGMIFDKLSEEHQVKMASTGIRNVTTITQAPTGSTGTMVNTSTGIEPYFAFEYFRESRLGFDKQYVAIAQEWIDTHPGEELPDYFATAQDLSAEDHVRVQAVIQKWVDSSISKTANAPNDFTAEDTAKLYELAYDLGCKGVTIYRDGSRDVQVLHTTKDEKKTEGNPKTKTFNKRPQVLQGKTIKTQTPFGKAYVTVNDNTDGDIEEIFIKLGKTGADIGVIADGLAIALTGALSPRIASLSPEEKLAWITKKFRRMSGATSIGFGPNRVDSLPDAIARVLELYMQAKQGVSDESQAELIEEYDTIPSNSAVTLDICPNCGAAALVKEEGCSNCRACGHSKCS